MAALRKPADELEMLVDKEHGCSDSGDLAFEGRQLLEGMI